MASSSVQKMIQRRALLYRKTVRDYRFTPEDLAVIIAAREDEFRSRDGWRSHADVRPKQEA
ncbi:hypothetical protein [Jatrophihabitans lederbergiae]|uniref:Uncharacterized protein n=1 Tax=Jatrophihabitans lederbergiae TaxID=3075547 RepID=A0ABU2JH63_9ACTN|nr:hypothetical protein [Jatrophihabitans sp. DSM 44399]MDT0264330.1 hypothetical protein [Jatrophihabitans sp. DSM 44399]